MKPYRMLAIAVALLSATATISESADLFKSRAEKDFEGSWQLVALEQDGSRLPPDTVRQLHTVFQAKDGTYSVSTAGTVTEQGKYELKSRGRAKEIDMLPSDGPFKGQTVAGIYELRGDSLTVCYPFGGGERPKKFQTRAESGLFLAEYRRVTP